MARKGQKPSRRCVITALKFSISRHAAARIFEQKLVRKCPANLIIILHDGTSWIGIDGFGLPKPRDLHTEALHQSVARLGASGGIQTTNSSPKGNHLSGPIHFCPNHSIAFLVFKTVPGWEYQIPNSKGQTSRPKPKRP